MVIAMFQRDIMTELLIDKRPREMTGITRLLPIECLLAVERHELFRLCWSVLLFGYSECLFCLHLGLHYQFTIA